WAPRRGNLGRDRNDGPGVRRRLRQAHQPASLPLRQPRQSDQGRARQSAASLFTLQRNGTAQMRRVGIVDYGLCNIDSIRRATEVCGGEPTVTRNPDELVAQDLLILPGVGAFGAAMANLDAWGLA